MLAPPIAMEPHPFAVHDVSEADWMLFLSHVNAAAAFSPMDKAMVSVAPVIKYVGISGMYRVSLVGDRNCRC